MDFSNMLGYLATLLNNKSSLAGDEFNKNLGLQQQLVNQRGTQFDANLALQQKAQDEANALAQSQLGQQGSEFSSNLALQKQIQDQANALAQQAQQFNERYQTQNTVVPGSALWFQMQNFMRPSTATGTSGNGYSGIPNAPFAYKNSFGNTPVPLVTFTPAAPGFR